MDRLKEERRKSLILGRRSSTFPSTTGKYSQQKRLSMGMDIMGPQESNTEEPRPHSPEVVTPDCDNVASLGNNNVTGSSAGNSPNRSPMIPGLTHYDTEAEPGGLQVKIICLGDSAVGKSKLMERFLQDSYKPKQLSTFALTIFTHKTHVNKKPVCIDFWDTAGQERFSSLHPSYYHQAHACIMVFDATRKVTYKNLSIWFKELKEYRPEIPCLLAVNKIDANQEVTKRTFAFADTNNIPLYYVSASDGTNVVKLFKDAIAKAVEYKENPTDWKDQLMDELEGMSKLKSGIQASSSAEAKVEQGG